jgi:hypothetical protein
MQDSSGNVLIKETFTSLGPTRASDCQCLPGYIPSNSGMADVKFMMFGSGGIILYTPTWARFYWSSDINDVNILLRCMGINKSYLELYNFTKDIENGSIPNGIYLNKDLREYNEIMNNEYILDAILEIFNEDLRNADGRLKRSVNRSIRDNIIYPKDVCSFLQSLPSSNKKGYSCLSLGDGSTKPCY